MRGLRWGAAVAAICTTVAAAPAGAVLPLATHLTLVLDGAVDSRTSVPGTSLTAHLAEPLLLAGRTLAPSGTRVAVHIVAVTHATSPDVDGSVEVQFDPLTLDGGTALPIRPLEGTLRPRTSSGRSSTSDLGDAAGTIFVPYYVVFRTFRKGEDFRLNPGAKVAALTEATVDASAAGALVIATPPPFHLGIDPVHSDVTPVPMATLFTPPPAPPRARPSPRPTIAPTQSPQAGPSATP